MRKFKKLIATVAALLLLVPTNVIPAFASGSLDLKIEPSKTQVVVGENVDYTISIANATGTNLSTIEFTLDIPDGFELVGTPTAVPEGKEKGGFTAYDYTAESMKFTAGGVNQGYNGDGFKILTFTVKANGKATGNVAVGIKEDFDFGDTNYETVTPKITSAPVKITLPASTIKINSYQGKTYDGQAVIDPTDITKTGSAGAVTFAYYDNEACTTPLSEVPKNAGDYWVKATVAGYESHEGATSAAKTFTIEKANYTFNEALLGLKKDVFIGNSYPQNGPAEAEGVTIPEDIAETVTGTISWYTDKSLKNPAVGKFDKVGDATLYYVFIPNKTEANYVSTPKTGSVAFKVTDLPLQDFTGEFGKAVSKTYGDTAFIVPAATTQGGEISYKSGNEKVATVNEKTGEVTIVGAGTAYCNSCTSYCW